MLKAFFKRVITEVVKELISPELASIRAEIKGVETSLSQRMDRLEERLDRFEDRLDRFDDKLDRINKRLDDLYLIVVRRDEHTSLEEDVKRLREDVDILKRRVGI